jgi:hypothetical protein
MTEDNARRRALGWCLGLAVVLMLIVSARSRTWIVVEADSAELHIGLWSEEMCSELTCHEIEGSDRQATPKAGMLGMPTLMFGLATGAVLLLQLFGVRTRVARMAPAAPRYIATLLVFRKDAWVPGPAYLVHVIACGAAIVAAALLPDPLPRSIPPRPIEPPGGGSAMAPPP